MTDSALAVVILAAGMGTRMKSARTKVLHPVGGAPMLAHVLAAARAQNPARLLVVSAQGDEAVAGYAAATGAESVVQDRPLGTGHAVRAAQTALEGFDGNLLVLFGDTPLLRAATLSALLARLGPESALAALGFYPPDPAGYGRMIRERKRLVRIVEDKDASADERAVGLCFAGPLAGRAAPLFDLLARVETKNAQGEYYLTDIVDLAAKAGLACAVAEAPAEEVMGVNSRADLAAAEGLFQVRRRDEMMAAGVTMTDPDSVFLSFDTVLAPDVSVGPFVVFGPGVRVEPGVDIRAFCHIEGAQIGPDCIIGPFARLRPGARLAEGVHIGNFVEVKNARIGKEAKANHLSYLGDAAVGADANIGAGTITCNYDGAIKTETRIGDNVFVGSNATLVAPLTVGAGAYIAAGSVVTKNVDPDSLVFGRARQTAKPGRAKTMRATRRRAKDER